jgi:pimeloyl-ACP methyl ester carboxylesterase
MTAIVLLPGMDGSGMLFGDFIAALGFKPLVVAYPPDTPLTYDELEHFVHRALPADEPYILLGESFSGPIAIRVASRKPPGLCALVLVCTFAALPPPRPPQSLQKYVAALPFWRLPIAVAAPALFGIHEVPLLRDRLLAAAAQVTPKVWRTRMHAVLSVDVTAHLADIDVPILYLRASADRIIADAACEHIGRAKPTMCIVSIDGPHALLQTKPVECAAALKQFVLDIGIASPAARPNFADS